MTQMKRSYLSASLEKLQAEHDRLRQRLMRVGYISQGSVYHRRVERSGRSGYQWTRKVAQKTITVALSQAQFKAMKTAIANERKLQKIIAKMERISRQIIFATTPDTARRKPLSKKVLGFI